MHREQHGPLCARAHCNFSAFYRRCGAAEGCAYPGLLRDLYGHTSVPFRTCDLKLHPAMVAGTTPLAPELSRNSDVAGWTSGDARTCRGCRGVSGRKAMIPAKFSPSRKPEWHLDGKYAVSAEAPSHLLHLAHMRHRQLSLRAGIPVYSSPAVAGYALHTAVAMPFGAQSADFACAGSDTSKNICESTGSVAVSWSCQEHMHPVHHAQHCGQATFLAC